jgi:DNA-binding MarR family transcriptional regulator
VQHEAVLNIVHTANMLSMVGSGFLRAFDLTEAQFNVLFALRYKQCDLTQSGLSRRLVVTRASITSVLDKLEEKGLVARQNVPGNRRIYHVALTPKGTRLFDESEPPYRDEIQYVMGGLDEAACKELIGRLELVRSRAQQRLSSGHEAKELEGANVE